MSVDNIATAHMIYQLASRGYPTPLAVRVACTPPLSVTEPPADDGSRPGRELYEGLERQFGQVVGMVAARVIPSEHQP